MSTRDLLKVVILLLVACLGAAWITHQVVDHGLTYAEVADIIEGYTLTVFRLMLLAVVIALPIVGYFMFSKKKA